jgi:hypothetical protein
MQDLKAVTMGVVASIEYFWSNMANPAIVSYIWTRRLWVCPACPGKQVRAIWEGIDPRRNKKSLPS